MNNINNTSFWADALFLFEDKKDYFFEIWRDATNN